MEKVLALGLGGFLGANARYWLSEWIDRAYRSSFPAATLLINVSGSFALGLYVAAASQRGWGDAYRLLFAVGFLGAYTTFSTFSLETLSLAVDQGRPGAAMLNILLSVVGGVVAAWIGIVVGRTAFPTVVG